MKDNFHSGISHCEYVGVNLKEAGQVGSSVLEALNFSFIFFINFSLYFSLYLMFLNFF